jgi:hypothetical protein
MCFSFGYSFLPCAPRLHWKKFYSCAWCDNPQSTFYWHVRTHHTEDIAHILLSSHLSHSTHDSGLDGLGQCLFKLVSSVPVFEKQLVVTLQVSSHHSCPVSASMILRRASWKSLWEIFYKPHEERCKCSEWPVLTDGIAALTPITKSSGWLISC